jgi:DNA-binding NarL/FixJ family response regulator
MSIRILLADDQELVRTGLRTVLESEEDFEVAGEAADGAEAVELALLKRPDVVLMDVRMPRMNGIEATRRIVGSDRGRLADHVRATEVDLGFEPTRVLILTTFDLDEYVYAALRAGASGFLLKDAPREQLAHAIRVVAAGDALLAPSVTRRLVEEFTRHPGPEASSDASLDELTERELDVLKLVCRGLSNAEIAQELVVEESTVKTHVRHLLQKLGLRDRVQAVVLGYEAGLVRPGPSHQGAR